MRAGAVLPIPLDGEEAPVQSDGFPWNFLEAHGRRAIWRSLVLWKGSCFRKIHLLKFLGVEVFIYGDTQLQTPKAKK